MKRTGIRKFEKFLLVTSYKQPLKPFFSEIHYSTCREGSVTISNQVIHRQYGIMFMLQKI